MESKWIFGIILSWIFLAECVPVEYVYTGDGCECPTRLGYHINVPKLPKPKRVIPCDHGYKIDVPPMQAKAKVSYTFDFSVEEPRPPRPVKQPKLDLYAKVDRISIHKEDCPELYRQAPAPPAPCRCGQCGITRPLYRYVNGKLVSSKCNCQKCKCHLRRRKTPFDINAIRATGTPVLVASGPLERSKNSIRRKRDLRNLFFRPRRQSFSRPARYVKLYHKNIPKGIQEKQGWFDMDLFSDANPFKRKTKKVFFPHTGARIVKRDIKGEYDLLEKEREAADLTLPEIIQFMPETLQPDFKRGPCQFGCNKACSHARQFTISEEETEKELASGKSELPIATDQPTISNAGDSFAETPVNDNVENDESNVIDDRMINAPTYTKRNAAIYGYQQAAAPPTMQLSTYIEPQSAYEADSGATLPSPSPTDPNYDSATAPRSPCEQRKIYAAMRRAAEAESKYIDDRPDQHKHIEDQGQLRLMMTSSSSVPDPLVIGGAPLQYAGDLETPQVGYTVQQSAENPIVGAQQYPVQHISSALLDRIITDIVYRHPEFIDATSHYGGALVDPEPYQDRQTKDFIKKLIDGRLGLLFGEPEDQYLHYYPDPSYSSHSHNPYQQSRPVAYYPATY